MIYDIEYLDEVLYCFSTCAVGTFDVAQAKWKTHPHSLSGLDYVPKNSTFLVEIDGDLHLFKYGPFDNDYYSILAIVFLSWIVQRGNGFKLIT